MGERRVRSRIVTIRAVFSSNNKKSRRNKLQIKGLEFD